MINTIAVHGYRSLRDLRVPLSRITVVTGANGAGKSSLYRALRLLADCAEGQVVASLAREGGLPSTLWAGPEVVGAAVRRGDHPVQGTVRGDRVSLQLGFAAVRPVDMQQFDCLLPDLQDDHANLLLASYDLNKTVALGGRLEPSSHSFQRRSMRISA